jgi:tyrosine-protein phosphatase SIW14
VRLNRYLVRAHLTAALLVGGVALPASAEPRPATTVAAADRFPAIHIDNFGEINANYYRGGQPRRSDYAELAAFGVRTVVNLTSDDAQPDERSLVDQVGMQYVGIPMTTRIVPTPDQIAEFLRIVNDPAKQPVFVHCVGGRHRTGLMTAIYRMTSDRWTAAQAFAEMKRFRFGADFLHPEFKQFVYAFHLPTARPAPAVVSAVAAPAAGKLQ